MVKFECSYLKLLLFMVLILYGCSTQVAKLPVKERRMEPIKPEPKITIPSSILSELHKFKVRSWKYIVIHHSASNSGNAYTIGKFHREVKGWENGLGYHFLIGNGNGSGDGEIEVGDRWNDQIDGAHAGNKEYNRFGIGICLIGNFENSYPTKLQISSLVYLINYLHERCNIPRENIKMHSNFRKTACPGGNFPYYEVMSSVR
ncbi:MAG: peptidoglycan recognition family protein [Candidatus Scalinduaceae bacterium]